MMRTTGGITLQRHGRPVRSVFDLLGETEDDMTAALGHLLAEAPGVLLHLLNDLLPTLPLPLPLPATKIRLQTARSGAGRTDIEVEVGAELFLVVEAKRGNVLPTLDQLAQYAPIVAGAGAEHGMLVTLTGLESLAADDAATTLGYGSGIDGVPVLHRSWRQVRSLARAARSGESNAGKRLIDHFTGYLDAILDMDLRYSNMVYVVSLASAAPDGWHIGWRDIVRVHRRYFYPAAGKGGWPEPPNYIGFRYDGQLRHIHHVQAVTVFTQPQTIFPEAAAEIWEPHYLLTLGPDIVPPTPLPNGPRVHRSNRVWCMLDTLFTASSISEALTETERRKAL